MHRPREIVLASHNPGKLGEFQRLLAAYPVVLSAPFDGTGEIVAETGATYLDNARLKAVHVARQTGRYALGDDSGVEVDALGGEPGIRSARFVSDDPWTNTREILLRLMAVPFSLRSARMVAALVLAAPDGQWLAAEGTVAGHILAWPRGGGGFGVDPIFTVDRIRSLAEADAGEKDRISHRGVAVRGLWEKIRALPGD